MISFIYLLLYLYVCLETACQIDIWLACKKYGKKYWT